jgi:hypothetical protein
MIFARQASAAAVLRGAMNDAYMSGIAALAGSAIGALASFATTWLTQHSQERAQQFVPLYALVGELRLFATANVILRAEQVMRLIVETYHLPNRDFRNPQERQEHDVDVLRAFSEACREELHI